MSDAGPADFALPACFRGYPGAVLILSGGGRIEASNGHLDRELGADLRGRVFGGLLDDASSLAKWERVLAEGRPAACELIMAGTDTLAEPRGFTILSAEDGRFWLLEQWRDPRMDHLQAAVTGVNSELSATQRVLVKEQARLASALQALEAQHRETERLAGQVRAQNAELERSNRALDEFAHAVSHDLKAPLRAIGNYARWVAEDHATALPPDARDHLARVQDRVLLMRRMIDGVLDFARAGRGTATPQPVHLADIIRDVLLLLDPPQHVHVHIGDMPVLVADRAPLQQVFHNLLANAVRYAGQPTRGEHPDGGVADPRAVSHDRPASPRVTVTSHCDGSDWEFAVADNGPGIAAHDQDRIWKLFHRLEPDGQAEGTGIGLAVVHVLVEGQGGRAWVESSLGAGATFRFTWPTAHSLQPGAAPPARP